MWTAGAIDPGPVIQARGLHDERVIIHPFAHRIAVPPRFGFLGKLAPVGPDDPPDFAERIEDENLLGSLKDLGGPHFIKVFARHSLWIASYHRIICIPGKNGSKPIARLVLVQGVAPLTS